MTFDPFYLLALADAPGESGWIQLLPIPIIFAIFYFLLLAPMRKRQRQLQKVLDAMKRGDKVVTTGGLYGEVTSVDGAVVVLKIADNVRVRVAKSAIAGLEGAPEQEVAK